MFGVVAFSKQDQKFIRYIIYIRLAYFGRVIILLYLIVAVDFRVHALLEVIGAVEELLVGRV
jgi:hypothetical protein